MWQEPLLRAQKHYVRSPSLAQPGFEFIIFRAWQYISCHWDAGSNTLGHQWLLLFRKVLPHCLRCLRWFHMCGLSDRQIDVGPTGNYCYYFYQFITSQKWAQDPWILKSVPYHTVMRLVQDIPKIGRAMLHCHYSIMYLSGSYHSVLD